MLYKYDDSGTGKLADLVVHSADFTKVEAMNIKDIPVEMNFVGGEVV